MIITHGCINFEISLTRLSSFFYVEELLSRKKKKKLFPQPVRDKVCWTGGPSLRNKPRFDTKLL